MTNARTGLKAERAVHRRHKISWLELIDWSALLNITSALIT